MSTTVPSGFTVQACRDALVAALKAMPELSTAKIQTYRRTVMTEAIAKELFFDGTRWHGWWVYASAVDPVSNERAGDLSSAIGTRGGGNTRTTIRLGFEGVYGLDDSAGSEVTWSNLVYLVTVWINGYGRLNIPGCRGQGPCQWNDNSYIRFAQGPLLHWARLSLALDGRTDG
jgi:hypothetical protein